MYTYVPQFDDVCQKSLLGLLSKYSTNYTGSTSIVASSPAPLPDSSYNIALTYDNGSLREKMVYVSPEKSPDRKALAQVDYAAKIVSFDNRSLYAFKLDLPRLLFPGMPQSPNETAYSPLVMDNFDRAIMAPYFSDAKSIDIYNLQNQKVLSIDVGYLAKVCGDGICEK